MVLFPELSCPANNLRDGVVRGSSKPGRRLSSRGKAWPTSLRVRDFPCDLGRRAFGFGREEVEDSNAYYEGQFVLNFRHGQGTLHSPDTGSKYVGQFQDDQFHGHGSLVLPDGSKYMGQWKNGRKHGAAEYISAEGLRYVGQWDDGRRHGSGDQEYLNGDRYKGWFYNGLCSGFGTYSFSDGSRYDGTWASGRYDGPGTFYGADGSRERHTYTLGHLTHREVLPPAPPPSPRKGVRRDAIAVRGKPVLEQTRADMHKPTILAHPTPSKYLIRRETAAMDVSAPPLCPNPTPALPCSCTVDDDTADTDAPPPVLGTSPALVQVRHISS